MDIETLIQTVAKKHQLLLDKDDPIFVTVTLNELMLGQYLEQLQTALAQSQAKIEANSQAHLQTCRQVASTLVTQTSQFVTQNVKQEMQAITQTVLADLQQQAAGLQCLKNQIGRWVIGAVGSNILLIMGLGWLVYHALHHN